MSDCLKYKRLYRKVRIEIPGFVKEGIQKTTSLSIRIGLVLLILTAAFLYLDPSRDLSLKTMSVLILAWALLLWTCHVARLWTSVHAEQKIQDYLDQLEEQDAEEQQPSTTVTEKSASLSTTAHELLSTVAELQEAAKSLSIPSESKQEEPEKVEEFTMTPVRQLIVDACKNSPMDFRSILSATNLLIETVAPELKYLVKHKQLLEIFDGYWIADDYKAVCQPEKDLSEILQGETPLCQERIRRVYEVLTRYNTLSAIEVAIEARIPLSDAEKFIGLLAKRGYITQVKLKTFSTHYYSLDPARQKRHAAYMLSKATVKGEIQ